MKIPPAFSCVGPVARGIMSVFIDPLIEIESHSSYNTTDVQKSHYNHMKDSMLIEVLRFSRMRGFLKVVR